VRTSAKSVSQTPVWQKALKAAADPPRARHYVEQLAATPPGARLARASAEQARVLAALFSGSPAMTEWLLKHPAWLETSLEAGHLVYPRQEQGLRREVNAWLQPALQARDYAGAFARLRQFKQREMTRIAARDLARLGDTAQITREISNVADVCLDGALRLCARQLGERLGGAYHQDAAGRWQRTQFAVVGLGKLGGQELNYSSDVDLIFVYDEEGHVFPTPPKAQAATDRAPTSHHFFKRLAEAFIAEVTRQTADGMLYRVDLRLRPEGDAGPLVRSLVSYETFYAQWGQTWERMMLIKARGVAGDAALAAEFLELVQPFRYPRSLNEGVLREIAAMKARIENEVVKAGELERNVKLGRGGIREIEFVVQTLQLLHGGRLPFLQGAQTVPLLQKLVAYKLLAPEEAAGLTDAYGFLRDIEHRLQMEQNLQTHTIPAAPKARKRLAALMGFRRLADFDAALKAHTAGVRQTYDSLLKAETATGAHDLPRDFADAAPAWEKILAGHRFRDPGKAVRLLNEFAHGPGYVHVSPRTVELAWQLIPKILALCPQPPAAPDGKSRKAGLPSVGVRERRVLSDPDRVLTRLDSFVSAYGTRALLFETWTHNPPLFELLLLLFDRSEFLAETAIRTPDLVDELVLSDRLRRAKTAAATFADLRHGHKDPDQRLWLRRYHEAEFMRIGLRDILGLADCEQSLVELSALADACLQYAVEVVLRQHRLKAPPFVVIGLGKLGGQEINYGSDLDIIFVADAKAKKLDRLARLAVEVMDLLSARTEQGVVFQTDARLRPDGEKGLLVNTLPAYEEYYRQRAQLWEIQALTRTRPIAGDLALGGQFQQLAARLTNFKAPSLPLAAFTPDWKARIAHMRQRIEKERTPAGQDALAIKTGAGGLIDAEFIAQTLSLAHGWQEASTLRTLARARDTGALPHGDADKLIENYRKLRRVEAILRRWSFEGETVLPADPAPFYRVSVRCGFDSPEQFREAVARYRHAIREVYRKVFPA
jgi:glutamate-ammonia-ligase adenylyltransferase